MASPGVLPPNYALVNVKNLANQDVRVLGVSDNCVGCSPSTLVHLLRPQYGIDINVEVSMPYKLMLQDIHDMNTVCSEKFVFGEYGLYNWTLVLDPRDGTRSCEFRTWKDPEVTLGPVGAVITFIFLMFVWVTLTYVIERIYKLRQALPNPVSTKDAENLPFQDSARIQALDVFRGMSVILMVYVNVGGGMFPLFHHALWYGVTFADFPQPWFLWIVGFSIALAMRRKNVNTSYRSWHFKISKRFVLLFFWGIVLHSELFGINLLKFRWMGVLQKIAVCYSAVALLQLHWCPEINPVNRRVSVLEAIKETLTVTYLQWIICLLLVAVHLSATFLIDLPLCGRGYQGPGGRHLGGSFESCAGGAATWIDKMVYGETHMVSTYPFAVIYGNNSPFEPDGILGTLTSIFQTFLGLQAGQFFLRYQRSVTLKVYLVYSLVLGVLALILSHGFDDDGWIPVTKMLWSLSFTLLTSSSAFLLLAICFYLVDSRKVWDGTPFVAPGMNSLLLLIVPIWTRHVFPFEWQVNTHWDHLVVDLWHTTLWVGITVYLHQRKIYWNV